MMMMMEPSSKISSSTTEANTDNVIDFDAPADSHNILNVINKNRVKVTIKRRKPTRHGHVSTRVQTEKEAKTFSNAKIPVTKSDVCDFNENSTSSIKTSEKSEPVKQNGVVFRNSQETQKMNLTSELKDLEIEEGNHKADMVSEVVKKGGSKDIFETAWKKVLEKAEIQDFEINAISEAALTSELMDLEIEEDNHEADMVSEVVKKDGSKNNFSPNENTITSVLNVKKTKENNFSKDIFENAFKKVLEKVVNQNIEIDVISEAALTSELKDLEIEEGNHEPDMVSEVAKKDESKNNFSPNENIVTSVLNVKKTKENNFSKDVFENQFKKVLEKVENQDLEINVISEAAKQYTSQNNFSFESHEEDAIPFVPSIEKKEKCNLPKSDSSEGRHESEYDGKDSNLQKSNSFEDDNESECDNLEFSDLPEFDCFQDDFFSKSSFQNLPEDVGFSTFFWHIYKRGTCTDVDFVFESSDNTKTFSAHKMILSLWSTYFADKFYGLKNNKEIFNIFKLSDISPEAFGAMLKFMYGWIPENMTFEKTFELYKVAEQFQVSALMKWCCKILQKTKVLPSNVFKILEFSEYLQNRKLRDKCLKLIEDNTTEVIKAYELCEVSPSIIHTFLDLPALSLENEFDLLSWLFAWSKTRCLKNSREIMKEFFPKLNFLSLSNNQFAELYRNQEAFFNSDEAVSIFMNIAAPGSMQMPNWYNENYPFRTYSGTK